ncbi:MAG: xanthine dehydrogenase subunit XdhB [Desulfotignum sp.]
MFDIQAHMKALSVDHAVTLLAEHPGTQLLAGGTDVLIRLRHGSREFTRLVDIHGLEELRFITIDAAKNIRIGSGTVFTDLCQSDPIHQHLPILAEAAESVGGPQIRNMATIGGNICNGAPSADSAPALFVLNARLELKSCRGIRQVPVANFYLGPSSVDLRPGEILLAIIIPQKEYQGYTGHYHKYAMRKAMDIATIGCAVSLKTSGGRMTDFRIAYGVAGPTPLRCPSAENAAVNQIISDTLPAKIADAVVKDVSPRTSWRATREFRRHIISELAERVTRTALDRARTQKE